MVRLLIGISGSGKTYYIQERILCGHMGYLATNAKNIYVVERKEYNEYSHLFHPDYVHVYKSDDDEVETLQDVKNADIIIDCEDYSEEFMDKVIGMILKAVANNNDVTITLIPSVDTINCENLILQHADSILVGECGGAGESLIENILHVKLKSTTKKYDFRKII